MKRSNNNSKKEKELRYAKIFQMQCKDLDGFKLENGDDPPDIVAIKDNHYSIGIEITEVYSEAYSTVKCIRI